MLRRLDGFSAAADPRPQGWQHHVQLLMGLGMQTMNHAWLQQYTGGLQHERLPALECSWLAAFPYDIIACISGSSVGSMREPEKIGLPNYSF